MRAQVTNEYTYSTDVIEVSPGGAETGEFSLHVLKDPEAYFKSSKRTKIVFSTEHRARLLTALGRARAAAADAGTAATGSATPARVGAYDAEWVEPSGARARVALTVGAFGLSFVPSAAAAAAASGAIDYCDMEAVRALDLSADGGGKGCVLYHSAGRMLGVACDRRAELLKALAKAALGVGVVLAVGTGLDVPPAQGAVLLPQVPSLAPVADLAAEALAHAARGSSCAAGPTILEVTRAPPCERTRARAHPRPRATSHATGGRPRARARHRRPVRAVAATNERAPAARHQSARVRMRARRRRTYLAPAARHARRRAARSVGPA